ncbi:MAG: Crp/Fnr family transcriptional regulator [Saprospiraceae bacterium]
MADHIEWANQILKSTYPFLTNADIKVLLEISQFHVCSNKEVLIKSGQNVQKSFFILKGMLRGYYINKKGEEKNIFLRPEHTITGAPECLFYNQPTKYTFESILETELLVFKFHELKELGKKHPNLIQVNFEGLQENIMTLISRVEALIDLTPEERYEALLERSPQFFQTAFNKHIANYLGITAVSLSRIIKRRSNSNN